MLRVERIVLWGLVVVGSVAGTEAFAVSGCSLLRSPGRRIGCCGRRDAVALKMVSGDEMKEQLRKTKTTNLNDMQEPPEQKLEVMKYEGLKADILRLSDVAKRGVDSPDGSAERDHIIELFEQLETMNPIPAPIKSDVLNGVWTLRWTTSESILGRKRMRGFRVDMDRPITQEIDTKTLTARNEEPITTFRWILGGIKYHNSVEANLEPLSDDEVMVDFQKFFIANKLTIKAPERARDTLKTTFLEGATSSNPSIRLSRGGRGNLFILTKD